MGNRILTFTMYRFNDKGSADFANALAELSKMEAPVDADFLKVRQLAVDPSLIQVIDGDYLLPVGPFTSRFDVCSRIYNAIKSSAVIRNFDPTDSFWSWLSAWYFNDLTSVVSSDGSVRRKLSKERESPAYIWSKSYKKAYRHRLGHGVFMLHHLGEVLAKPMLLSHPGSMSDYCEQTFARVGSYKEKAVIEAAHSIYFDGEKVLQGASTERRWGLRHLHREVAQCLINYEMHEMTTDELLAFLPASFKNKGFKAWANEAKLSAYLVHKVPNGWHEMLGIPEGGALQWLADRIGCTKRDLDQTFAELKVLVDNKRDQGWLATIEAAALVHGEKPLLRAIVSAIVGSPDKSDARILTSVASL